MNTRKYKTQIDIFNVACLIIILCHTLVGACVDEPIVETQSGKVRGAKVTGAEGVVFCEFKGIPYAKAPVGELRFKDSEPAKPWTGVLNTKVNGPFCAQIDFMANKPYGSEDCLYMNIYAKNIDLNARKPVMVWIHGGVFYSGSGDDSMYGPDYFMSKDIVLVSINYRLNVFGFLNLDDEVAPGNMGLKDQLLALQWVRDNIAKFGGDPDNITIFGNSAGAASVHYFVMSPLTKGLYHKAIMQSGAAFNPWAFQLNPKERAYQLSKYLGHTDETPVSIVQFLRKVDTQTILEALEQMFKQEEKMQMNWHFGPSIDSKSKNPFLPIHPEIAAESGIHVPLIIGHNNREGILLYNNLQNNVERYDKEFEQLLHPAVENIVKSYNLSFENLRHIYFGNASITNDNIIEAVDLTGDLYFVEGTQKIVKIQIEKSSTPTYYYQYTYDKSISLLKLVMQTKMSGASHTDETFAMFLPHIFEGKIPFPAKGTENHKVIEQLIELWVNFATTGIPTPKPTELVPIPWEPVKNQTYFEFLNICENLRMDTMPTLKTKYTTYRT